MNEARVLEEILMPGSRLPGVDIRPAGPTSQPTFDTCEVGVGGSLVPLSARERQIVLLIAGGRTDRQMADALNISRKTVSNHVTNILRKLRVQTRAAAVARMIAEPHIATTPVLGGHPAGSPTSP